MLGENTAFMKACHLMTGMDSRYDMTYGGGYGIVTALSTDG